MSNFDFLDDFLRFFRGTLANFCKSKKCVIFNVDYHPGSKKLKFDTTLIRHSPFNISQLWPLEKDSKTKKLSPLEVDECLINDKICVAGG